MKMEELALSFFPYPSFYSIQRDFIHNFVKIVENEAEETSDFLKGKTTSLLCSALAWIIQGDREEKENNDDNETGKDVSNAEPEWIRAARAALPRSINSQETRHFKHDRQRRKKKPRTMDDLDESVRRILDMVRDESDKGEEDDGKNADQPLRRVYYCSRTHSQLSQVMGELKKIVRQAGKMIKVPAIKAISLASRRSTCLNPKVNGLSSAEAINEKCQELVAEDLCPFYNRDKSADMKALEEALVSHQINDIEDSLKMAKDHEACAYFAGRAVSSGAQIIALPYQMLLERSAREAAGLDLQESLIIFDEGHNLVDVINEMRSASITSTELGFLKMSLRRYLDRFAGRLSPESLVLLQQLQQIVVRVAERILGQNQTTTTNTSRDKDINWKVNEFLLECNIDHINMLPIIALIKGTHLSVKLPTYYEGDPIEGGMAQILNKFSSLMAALTASDADGRLIVSHLSREGQSLQLKYIALNPATLMAEICSEAHTVILAGGTMRPIDDVILQLFGPEKSAHIHSYSCGHLPGMEKNICGILLPQGPSEKAFRFTLASRDDKLMLDELSQTLSNVCNVVPDGIVCFFASYQALDHFVANWTNRSALEKKKKIYIETPGGATTAETLLKNYQHAVYGGGALLLAVMGGRLSEGVNFSDRLARAVLVVGLPFANLNSPETRERAEHYARLRPSGGTNEYLENLCMRSVNQTIGRAIRHINDYAAIILIDERYQNGRIKSKLPTWIQSCLLGAEPSDFASAFSSLVQVNTILCMLQSCSCLGSSFSAIESITLP